MKKRQISLLIVFLLQMFGPKAAQMIGEIPECQFTAQPTAEQISACQAATVAIQGSQKAPELGAQVPPSGEQNMPIPTLYGQGEQPRGPGVRELEKPLSMIKEGLMRAEMGYAKSRDMGVDVTQADEDLLEQAREAYHEARTAFDNGDFASAGEKLQAMKGMNLENKFKAFKSKAMPESRQVEVMARIANGIKALELTIEHAKEYGIETAELEALLEQVKTLATENKEAHSSKDLETFLSTANEIHALDINDKVNAIIRKLANAKTKGLVEEGITTLTKAVDDIKAGLELMAKQKIDITRAAELAGAMSDSIEKAKDLLDDGDNMGAGKMLDKAVQVLIPLGNILKDNGVKLASNQMADLNAAMNADRNTDGLNIADNQNGKAQGVLNSIRPEDIPSMKSSMMEFSPELMDRVMGSRDKDKQFIDAIMRDVMPLVPEKDRVKTMEGSLGLMEESRAADKTIAQLKQIKLLPKAVIAQMTEVREKTRSYNFPPQLSGQLDAKLADLNDQIQSGQIKSVEDIKKAVAEMKAALAKAMLDANQQKYKQGLIPAKNIDTDNQLFDEVNYLKQDGAVRADKNGMINLNKKMDQAGLAVLINNALDKKEITPAAKKQTVMDVIKTTFGAYDVAPVNMAKPNEVVNFMKKLGVDLKPADLNKQATYGQAVDIVAEADQRWGVAPR